MLGGGLEARSCVPFRFWRGAWLRVYVHLLGIHIEHLPPFWLLFLNLILVSCVNNGNEHAHLITSFLPPCSEWGGAVRQISGSAYLPGVLDKKATSGSPTWFLPTKPIHHILYTCMIGSHNIPLVFWKDGHCLKTEWILTRQSNYFQLLLWVSAWICITSFNWRQRTSCQEKHVKQSRRVCVSVRVCVRVSVLHLKIQTWKLHLYRFERIEWITKWVMKWKMPSFLNHFQIYLKCS